MSNTIISTVSGQFSFCVIDYQVIVICLELTVHRHSFKKTNTWCLQYGCWLAIQVTLYTGVESPVSFQQSTAAASQLYTHLWLTRHWHRTISTVYTLRLARHRNWTERNTTYTKQQDATTHKSSSQEVSSSANTEWIGRKQFLFSITQQCILQWVQMIRLSCRLLSVVTHFFYQFFFRVTWQGLWSRSLFRRSRCWCSVDPPWDGVSVVWLDWFFLLPFVNWSRERTTSQRDSARSGSHRCGSHRGGIGYSSPSRVRVTSSSSTTWDRSGSHNGYSGSTYWYT